MKKLSSLLRAFLPSGSHRPSREPRRFSRTIAARTIPHLERLEDRCLPAVLPPAGLVSWWRAEGNAQDFADGNHGTLRNGAGFAPGLVGQAFRFDGGDDFVEVPDAASLDFAPPAPFTMELWAKRTSLTAVQHLLGKRIGCEPNDFNYQVPTPTADLPLDTWAHLAHTFDGTTYRVYIDGTLTFERPAGSNVGPANDAPLRIGTSGSCHTRGEGFGGLIDEPAIYNRALSAAEIQAIVAAGAEGKATIVVTTTADVVDPRDGVVSLREAIEQANATPGRDVIGFNIPATDPGHLYYRDDGVPGQVSGSLVAATTAADDAAIADLDPDWAHSWFTIAPATALPTITEPLILDGYTQPGASPNTLANGSNAVLRIELNGASAEAAHGLFITAGNSTVRGLVINRFGGSGISLATNGNNVIEGNFIGTNAAGTNALGNDHGLFVFSASNRVGTDGNGVDDPAERNVLSGNANNGVSLFGAAAVANVVAGNYIGTDASGTLDRGNARHGVAVFSDGAHSNRVGTNGDGVADVAERNIISGNGGGFGVDGAGVVFNTADNNVVAGNYIGTDVTGTVAIPNNQGVRLDGNSHGNRIGTDGDGVADAAERNVISGNRFTGVQIEANVAATGGQNSGNTVTGNSIGTTTSGTAALGNGGDGVLLVESSNNTIGGTGTRGNVIAFNGGHGVWVIDTASIGNPTRGNAIHSNAGLGINLGEDGVTPNDHGDGDSGANGLQNFPVLTHVSADAASTTIEGTLDSAAEAAYRIEFFASDTADPSTHGEGRTFLGAIEVTTDGMGSAPFSADLPTAVAAGQFVTATATRLSDHDSNPATPLVPTDTSEFSEAVVATAADFPADLSVRATQGAVPSLGGDLTYSIMVTNNGPNPATGVTLTDLLPAGAYFWSATATKGTVGHQSGTVTVALGDLRNHETAEVTIIAHVVSKGTLTNAVSVAATQADPDETNNTSVTTTRVTGGNIYVVNSPADPGDGVGNDAERTLREAILAANASPGADLIAFAIAGDGPHTIHLTSALPAIEDAVVLDGYTQPGSRPNSLADGNDAALRVELNGTGAGNGVAGLTITSGNSIVRGLALNQFSSHGIVLAGGGSNLIEGNFIGTDAAGTNVLGNSGDGIRITDASNNTIGGNVTAAGNLVLGNALHGIDVTRGDANRIRGNVVSGNGRSGVLLDGIRNIVQGNRIGTNVNGAPQGNRGHGLFLAASARQNVIDGGNTIAHNGGAGVFLDSDVGNTIRANSIFLNTGLGIDLFPEGPSPNDPGDSDPGSNNLQNHPILATAVSGSRTAVAGQLHSAPSTNFTLDFYAASATHPSGFAAAELWLGSRTVTTDSTGAASFQFTFPSAVPLEQFLTATATDPAGNTSELSPPVQVTAAGTANLAVTVSASPDPVVVGDRLVYLVTVANNGPDAATELLVTDQLPADATFLSAAPTAGSYAVGGGVLTWELPALATGANAALALTVVPGEPGTLTNRASVQATQVDPNPSDDTTTIDTTVVPPNYDLVVTRAEPAEPAVAGTDITYTIVVTNRGPETAPEVILIDQLPSGTSFVSATATQGTFAHENSRITFALGTLSDEASATVTITVHLDPALGSPVVNTVTAQGFDLDTANNTATMETTVIRRSELSVSVTAVAEDGRVLQPGDSVAIGERFSYRITVTNNGPSVANLVGFTAKFDGDVSVSAGSQCDINLPLISCEMRPSRFAPGTSASVQIGVSVRKPWTTGLTMLHLSSDVLDPDLANHTASVQLSVRTSVINPGDILFENAGSVIALDPETLTARPVLYLDSVSLGAVMPDGDLIAYTRSSVPPYASITRTNPASGTQTVITSGGELQPPLAMDVAPNGDIFVMTHVRDLFGSDNVLIRVNPVTGAQTIVASDGSFSYEPTDIAVGLNGSIFITALDIDGSGEGGIIQVVPITGTQSILRSGVRTPQRLAVAPDGTLVVQYEDFRFLWVDPVTGYQSGGADLLSLYDGVASFAIAPDGDIIASGERRVWYTDESGFVRDDIVSEIVRRDLRRGGETLLFEGGGSGITIARFLSFTSPLGNGPDHLVLRRSGDQLQLLNNGQVVASGPLSLAKSVVIQGAPDEEDSLTIDFTDGLFFVHGGIRFDGGGGEPNSGGRRDSLRTVGVFEGPLTISGDIQIPRLDLGSGGVLKLETGSAEIAAGTSAGRMEAAAGATLNFTGSFNLEDGASFAGAGSIRVDPADPCCNVTANGRVVAERLEVGPSGVLTVNGTLASPQLATPQLIVNSGTLLGTGIIQGGVQNLGRVSPGRSPGILTIQGDYTQTADGVLDVEIGGTAAGAEYDQLRVGGTAVLDGTLNVLLVNGFTPELGDTFEVLQLASRQGNFTAVTGGLFAAPLGTSFALVDVRGTASGAFAASLYRDLLGRTPDRTGLVYWSDLVEGGVPRGELARALTHSDEYFAAIVKPAYRKFLGREAEPDGLAYWVGRMRDGLTGEQLAAAFLASPEYYAFNGGTERAWVQAMYRDLLDRQPDQPGEDYWVNRLRQGAQREEVAHGFAAGDERDRIAVQGYYATFLGREAAAEEVAYWVSLFRSGQTQEDVVSGFAGSDEYFLHHSVL